MRVEGRRPGLELGGDCGVMDKFAWAERPKGEGRFAWVVDGGCVPGIAERARD